MKKSFLLLLLSLVGCSTFSQTGWVNLRAKQEFRDSVNFTRGFRINDIQVTLNGNEFNILDGALVTVAELNRIVGLNSPVQTQINNLQAQIDDTITLQDVVMRKHRIINAQSGTSYTLALSDDSKIITMSNSAANTITVPLNTSVAFYPGTLIDIIQLGTGQTTIAGASGVTINTSQSLDIGGRYGLASLIKIAENNWIAYGDLDTTGVSGETGTLTDGLYGHWKFENNAEDSFGSYDGTATNISYVTGVDGYAASFNGTTSKIVIGNVIKPTSAFSLSLWTKDGGQSTERHLVNNTKYDTSWKGWRLTRYNDNSVGVLMSDGSGNVFDQAYGSNYSNDAWHHTVFSWDGTTAFFYKDGVKSTGYSWSYVISYATTHNLTFGANDEGTANYDGEMDELRIYSRALTDAETLELWHEFDD